MRHQNQRTGAIRVMGLVSGNHKIEDINRDVPYGEVVVISGEEAIRSKDLWRSIEQRYILKIKSVVPFQGQQSGVGAASNRAVGVLETQVQELSARLQALEAENRALREKDDSWMAQKLDEILLALQERPTIVMQGPVPFPPSTSKTEGEKIDGSAPMFLPDEIRPKDVQVRIDVPGESAPSEALQAANQLRKLKQRQKAD